VRLLARPRKSSSNGWNGIPRISRSQQAWIKQHDQLVKDLQFKYLEGKVLEEERKGVNATVTVKVRLFVVIGEVRQVERYTLKKVDGAWLIDGPR